MDIETGEFFPFNGKHTFAPRGSIVVIDDGTKCAETVSGKVLKS